MVSATCKHRAASPFATFQRGLMYVGLLALVTGCAGTGAFRHTDHPAIKSVSLHDDIDKPEHLLYEEAASQALRSGSGFTLQEGLENSARIKEALTVAAQLTAKRLVKNIR